MDFDEALALSQTDLFAGKIKDEADNLAHQLKKVLHPDVAPDGLQDEATNAFVRVTEAYEKYLNPGPKLSTMIHTRDHIYSIDGLAAEGSITKVLWARMLDDNERRVLIKMPVHVRDNDLMEVEAKVLKVLAADKTFGIFFPQPIEFLIQRDATTREKRRCVVLEPIEGFYTMTSLLQTRDGLDPRDIAWLFRRLYAAMAFVHRSGFTHNALTPDNILVSPEQHHVIITGWGYSTPIDKPMQAINSQFRGFYPPEVFAKKPKAGSAADVFMLGNLMNQLGGANLPKRMRLHARAMSAHAAGNRPNDLSVIQDVFDTLLNDVFGPPSYHEMPIPAAATLSLTTPPDPS